MTGPSRTEFEALFVNNPDLDRIAASLNRFNPIKVMRMEGMEIRHSNILAWLMDPQESHGLGDRFVKAFLAEAMKTSETDSQPNALDIIQADLSDVEVRREWQRIDLFILSRLNNWAFIIENKWHAKQREGQLASYHNLLNKSLSGLQNGIKIRGIFLTLHGEAPDDKKYVQFNYGSVARLLHSIISSKGNSLGDEVRAFIEHYTDIVKEVNDMSDEHKELEKLAQNLYRNHSKVLNFIWQHGFSSGLDQAREIVFGEDWGERRALRAEGIKVVSMWRGVNRFSFLPESMFENLGGDEYKWPGCENWWAGLPLICWFQLHQNEDGMTGAIKLYAEVGPLSDELARIKLIDCIESAARDNGIKAIQFNASAKKAGAKYSRFLRNNSILIEDVSDPEEISSAIRELITRFYPALEAIAPKLANIDGWINKEGA